MNDIIIQIHGLKEIQAKFREMPDEILRALEGASTLVGDYVLNTVGLRQYPPISKGNLPPPPYYIRGVGTQVSATRNRRNSERLGTKFYSQGETQNSRRVVTRIGNVASYAPYVVGDQQSRAMARIGWRKLSDVAKEKSIGIGEIYWRVISDTLNKLFGRG